MQGVAGETRYEHMKIRLSGKMNFGGVDMVMGEVYTVMDHSKPSIAIKIPYEGPMHNTINSEVEYESYYNITVDCNDVVTSLEPVLPYFKAILTDKIFVGRSKNVGLVFEGQKKLVITTLHTCPPGVNIGDRYAVFWRYRADSKEERYLDMIYDNNLVRLVCD